MAVMSHWFVKDEPSGAWRPVPEFMYDAAKLAGQPAIAIDRRVPSSGEAWPQTRPELERLEGRQLFDGGLPMLTLPGGWFWITGTSPVIEMKNQSAAAES